MLTGNEKIKDLNDNDILNWLCNGLGTKCTKGYFEHANNHLGKYRILHVEFEKPFKRIEYLFAMTLQIIKH